MQNLKHYVRLVEKFTTDNSPALLTAIGVAGTISTALLSGKAHVRATDIRRREQGKYAALDTRKDVFKAQAKDVWKVYVPPISVAAVTCTAIVSANRIGTRRTAALAAAYATSEKAFDEYKDKVIEKFGEKDEEKVRDEVAADQLRKNPQSPDVLANADEDDKDWFYDERHGRYFRATRAQVDAAVNQVNHELNINGDVSLNTFYSWLGVNTVPEGEELGWRADKGLVDIHFSSHLRENGRPATVMTFRLQPIRNYDSAYCG